MLLISEHVFTTINQTVHRIAWNHTVRVSGWKFSYTWFHGVAVLSFSIDLFGTTQFNISVNFHIAVTLYCNSASGSFVLLLVYKSIFTPVCALWCHRAVLLKQRANVIATHTVNNLLNIIYNLLTAVIVYVSYGFFFPHQLEKLIEKNYFLHKSAQEAYKAYIRAYDSHSLKQIYDVNNLDLPKVSLSFGFKVPPFVDLSILLLQCFKAEFLCYKCSLQLAKFLWYLKFCCFVVGVGFYCY